MSETFKLSKSTRKILDNFSWINNTVVFRPGNVITFVSEHRDIIAFAEVEETFPQRFAIGNISKLLSLLPLYDDDQLSRSQTSV